MRRIFEKSICKCPRCVVKRRIRFLTVLGICIAMAAGCHVLVDHSKLGVPPSSNAQEAPAEEPTLDANAIAQGRSKPLSIAATQPGTSWKQQDTKTAQEPVAKDGLSADSLERSENLTPSDGSRNLADLPSSNLIGEVPMPHTNGWQTAVMGDAPESAPRGEAQDALQLDGAKVAAAVKPEPSPDSHANATSWSSAHPYDFARVIQSKIHNIRHRSPARLRFVDVKMRLIALWHQSLARSQRPSAGQGFWNSNKGER